MKFADLHLHTVFSDGTYTPGELVLGAEKAKLSAIAVTDHDIVEGIKPTLEEATDSDIEVIPGIELTAEYDGREIHILGYYLDYKNNNLIDRLKILKDRRVERIYKIVDKLNDLGIKLDPQSVFDLAKHGTVGRLHVARALLAGGFVNSIFEAFQKYIGDKCPAYVLGFRFSPDEAIKLIKDNRGVPVLAHPYVIYNDELVVKLIKEGIMGLEAYYPEHTTGMTNIYLEMAKKYNLLVTGGSDCHGSAKPEVKIGSIKIPYELVEKIKKVAQETK